jgi:outer membrane receptor protein involved in Fe transport
MTHAELFSTRKALRIATAAFALLCAMLLGQQAQAQNPGEITGVISDSLGAPVHSATVSLINLQDSTLLAFYLTDDDGAFVFKRVPLGRYRVVVSRLGYFQQARTLELTTAQPGLKMESINMSNNDVTLGDVLIVEEAPPVTLKGDTLEFNAGSFKTAPNAVAEDLLKKLPGVEVQSDGTIKVNGQTVSKVLVDGKEFFGADPKIATRNLPSEAIKKVQVFDNKNEAEQVTGMDDGQTEMAINLTLKDEYKDGLFGQVSAGGGVMDNRFDRWVGKASINAFNKKSQYSLIANGNNINEAAFSWMELMQFTGGFRDMMEGGGSFGGRNSSGSGNNDDGIGFPIQSLVNSQSQGVNTQTAGGIRASRDWNEKVSLQGSYFLTYYQPHLQSMSSREYFLQDSTYTSLLGTLQDMRTLNHRIDADLRINPKPNVKFRFKPLVSFYSLNSDIQTLNVNTSDDGLTSAASNNATATRTGAWIYSGDARFTKGFRRKGRSFTATWTGNYRPSDSRQDINTTRTFITPDTTFASPANIQRWQTAAGSHNETVKLTYTEPFAYRWLTEFGLNGGLTASENTREAFAYNTLTQQYDSLLSTLSNSFNSQFIYGSAGLKFKRAGKKLTFTVGANWQQSQLTGSIPTSGFEVRRDFGKLLPNAQATYQISRFRTITLNYRSNLRAPSVSQLQPLLDVSNPLNISTGNPDLDAQTDHNVTLQFRFMDPARDRFISLNLTGNVTESAIAQSQDISSEGVSIIRPVNVDGNWNTSARLNAQAPIKKLKSTVAIEPRASLSRSVNLVNGETNPALTTSATPRLRWTFAPTDSFEIELRGDVTFTRSTFLVGSSSQQRTYGLGADLLWLLPKGFTVSSSFTCAIVQSTSTTTTVPLWQANVSKSFLKSQRAEIKLSTFDVLGRNTGISQTVNAQYSELLTYNALTRYYMATLTYRLSPYKPETGGRRNMFRMMMGG